MRMLARIAVNDVPKTMQKMETFQHFEEFSFTKII